MRRLSERRRTICWYGLLYCGWMLATGCDAPAQPAPPRALAGQLNLSTWDFVQQGPVALSGEYEFYWRKQVLPEEFAAAHAPAPNAFMLVPGVWNGFALDNETLPGEGFATYRLRVQIREALPLALKFLDMATAYTVYVNGTPVLAVGDAGTTRESSQPCYLPQVVRFTPPSRELDLVLHVSNFHHRKGGPWEAIKLGLPQQLQHEQNRALQRDALLFGCIVIMGLYHLGLFGVRPNERAPLYFGIFCLLIALRHIAIGERLLLQFFPLINWEALGKIEYLTYYLAPVTGALLLYTLYKDDFSQHVLRAIQFVSAAFCLVVLFTPVRIFSHTVALHHAYTILCCLYGAFVMILSVVHGREGARIHFLGFSFLFIAVLNDILNYFGLLQTALLLPFGLLAFIFAQAVLLSFRFSNAFRTIDWQRTELEKVIRQYERELIEKRRLEVQYRSLYNDNPTMYFTVDEAGRVLSVNQFGLQYLGYKAEELLGKPVTDVFVEEDRARVPQQLALCLNEPRQVHEWELRKRRKDGSVLWVKEFARCVQGPTGQPLLLIVCEDITARKQAEEEVHVSHERLRALSAHLQELLEQERVDVARDLHDELGQSLTSLKMDLHLLQRKLEQPAPQLEVPQLLHETEAMQEHVLVLINKVRDLVSVLRPAVLDTLGLLPALEWQLEEFQKRTHLRTHFTANTKELHVAKDHAVAAFRIFQECLSNIRQHANASSVHVKVALRGSEVWVEITDDGKGFSEAILPSEGKFGILGMRERALAFGSEIEIQAGQERGTTIRIKIPTTQV